MTDNTQIVQLIKGQRVNLSSAAKNILRQGLNIMSGLGTKSDIKQKRMEASG